jgi:hypothetical protein
VELTLFEEVADAIRGLIPPQLGPLRQQVRRYGIKVWLGPERPPREHYEAQVIGASGVGAARVLALEVGFHSEHPRVEDNDKVLSRLRAAEKRWRPILGKEAVVGPFIGRPGVWRRISETWPDPDLGDTELPVELAVRLTDYVVALTPVLGLGDVPDEKVTRRIR